MFTKGSLVYADVGYYLESKKTKSICLSSSGNPEDFIEVSMPKSLNIKILGTTILYAGRLALAPKTLDYVGIKTQMIKTRYSNDDQIALMLNEASSEEDKVFFNKMQEWREWSGWFAKEVMKVVESQKQ